MTMVLGLTTIVFLSNIKSVISKTFIYCTLSLGVLSVVTFYSFNPLLLEQHTIYKIIKKSISDSDKKETGTIAVRINGVKFYYEYFKKTAFLGIGMSSGNSPTSVEALGFKEGHYLFTDLGIFAMLFRFGIFGFILTVVILTRTYKDLSFIQNNGNTGQEIIASSLTYFFISTIIFIPAVKGFFDPGQALYYGIFFYFIYKLKSGITLQDSKNCGVII